MPFGVNVTPSGRVPVLVTVVATGNPAVVVTGKFPAVPAWKVAWSALLIVGDSLTLRMNAWLSDGRVPLSALMVKLYCPPLPTGAVPARAPAAIGDHDGRGAEVVAAREQDHPWPR